jgi:hypothetical protein
MNSAELERLCDRITPTKAEQLRVLTDFGYSEKTTATWSDERIKTVLAARRRDAKLGLARAKHAAERIDGSRGQPNRPERWQAAAYLAEVLDGGGDGIVNALLYCGHVMTDGEAREFAVQLIGKLRDGLVTKVERVTVDDGEDES